MKVCVQGLWHLGSVAAACLASVGHDVVGLDDNFETIAGLIQGKAPLFEPGLDDLLKRGIHEGNLRFTTNNEEAAACEVLWVGFDTPVDDDDQADIEFVESQVIKVLPLLADGALVLLSSQMPVGTVKKLELFVQENCPGKSIHFACSPENLRLGKALDVFLKPDRIVVGIRSDKDRHKLGELLLPITDRIEWMSVESAEMTKHAINAFLATSVVFANEIASICELVGADAKEVERGLKTDVRIGPKAYLSPGGPFAGGTLARDIEFLTKVSRAKQLGTPVLSSVKISNDQHKNWVRRKILEQFSSLDGIVVALWGLTYKPGTNTLRRSQAVELCDWLITQGACVNVYDPVVRQLPEHWGDLVKRHDDPSEMLKKSSVLIVGTEWPQFREEAAALLPSVPKNFIVIDANRHLESVAAPQRVKYIAVGTQVVKQR